MGAENNPQYKKRDVPNQSLREGVPPRSEPIPQQPKQPEQTLPQQEGVVDELTRVLGGRGNNLIFEAHLREAVRQLAQIYYKKAPSREVIARRNEEERQ